MRIKNLLILLIVTIVLVGLAYQRARLARQPEPSAPGQAVFPNLDVNRVVRVTVSATGDTTTIDRVDGHWQIAEKYGYPVDFARLRNLLTAIADLKIGRHLSLDAALRRELQLLTPTDPAVIEAAGIRIELLDSNRQPLAALTLGAPFYRERDASEHPLMFQWRGADGRYILTHTGDALLVSEPFTDVSAQANDWMDRSFLDIPSHELVGVELTGAGLESVTLTRASAGDAWSLQPMPANAKLDNARINELVSGLGALRFDDIIDPASDPETLGLAENAARHVSAWTTDGRRFKLIIGTTPLPDGRAMLPLRAAVTYEPPAGTAEDTAEPDVAAALATTLHQRLSETQRIQTRIGRWIYLIDSASANAWLFEPADLLAADPPHPSANAVNEMESP